MTELKKCPFCGSEATNPMTKNSSKYADCSNQDCITNKIVYVTVDEWNTRPIEDALQARIDELEQYKSQAPAYIDGIADFWKDKCAKQDARIATLESQLRWIPVEEGLPEPLPLRLYDVKQVYSYDILRGICYFWYSGWIDHKDGSNWNKLVTHYRPIPELPNPPEEKA
jgi:hypothetical protein